MIYWQLGSTPELRDMAPAVRAALVKQWVKRTWWSVAINAASAVATVVYLFGAGFVLMPAVLSVGLPLAVDLVIALVVCSLPVPLIQPVNVALMRPRLRSFIRRTWKAGRPPICYLCQYDLRGTPGPSCPECGAEIPRIDLDHLN